MEVILIERMKNLGNIGDVVRVKDGYARNFLLPQNKALRANKSNLAVFEAKRAEIEARNADAKKEAEKIAKSLDGVSVVVIRQASDDGRLYGSVNARDIAQELAAKKHNVDRKLIEIGTTIKEIGIYPVRVTLHAEVVAEVKVNVARSQSEAEAAAKGKPKKADKEAAPAADKADDAAAEAEAAAPAEEAGNEDAA